MKNYRLAGCGTALVTPFKDGAVDYASYRRLVERQVEGGIDFLVPLGSTAETPCLSDEEKVKLLAITREAAPDKILVAGAGTNSLSHTLANMKMLEQADMYLIVVPYYNKPTQRGMYEYFKAVAEATEKPIVLYNVPGRTGVNMTAKTTLQLAQIPNIVAIKEASGNLAQIREIIAGAPAGFSVLSGNDDQTLDLMMEGGHGVISVASNVVPEMMVNLTRAAAGEDYNAATKQFLKLIPLFDACFVESNPIPVKAALHILGLISNELRLPLTTCEPSTLALMEKVLSLLK